MSDLFEQQSTLNLFLPSTNWTISLPIEKNIKSKIEKFGVKLGNWDLAIYRGVLTGFNDAFVIDGKTREKLIFEDPKSVEIIRPILRGRDIKRYMHEYNGTYLISTFPSRNYDIDDFPAVKQYLLAFDRRRLEQTGATYTFKGLQVSSRKKTNNKWFETQDSINYWEEFNKQKILYPCIMAKQPCFTFDPTGLYTTIAPGNIITGNNLEYLLALLCSKTYYFAIRKFYMGGGIEGELKTNRLLMLPVMPFEKSKNANEIVRLVKAYLIGFEDHLLIDIERLIQDDLNLTKDEIYLIEIEKY